MEISKWETCLIYRALCSSLLGECFQPIIDGRATHQAFPVEMKLKTRFSVEILSLINLQQPRATGLRTNTTRREHLLLPTNVACILQRCLTLAVGSSRKLSSLFRRLGPGQASSINCSPCCLREGLLSITTYSFDSFHHKTIRPSVNMQEGPTRRPQDGHLFPGGVRPTQ